MSWSFSRCRSPVSDNPSRMRYKRCLTPSTNHRLHELVGCNLDSPLTFGARHDGHAGTLLQQLRGRLLGLNSHTVRANKTHLQVVVKHRRHFSTFRT